MSEKEDEKSKRSYTTTNIPNVLVDRIDRLIESGRGGYVSRSDFILDAIRRRLRDFDMIE